MLCAVFQHTTSPKPEFSEELSGCRAQVNFVKRWHLDPLSAMSGTCNSPRLIVRGIKLKRYGSGFKPAVFYHAI
jgi:hypothetical protein